MPTAVILEDEQPAVDRLVRLLHGINPTIRILESFETIQETAEYFSRCTKQPDILFIDIHVADGNSFELFDTVPVMSRVIFTTAYDEYAVQAFRQNAIDYLLKPIKVEELREAIEKIRHSASDRETSGQKTNYKRRFLIRFGNKFNQIQTDDIAYIYSQNKISYFVSRKGHRIPSDYKLQDLEQLLSPDNFFRINRQFIVHIDAIKEIKLYTKSRLRLELFPAYKDQIIISTQKSPEFKKWLDR